MKSYVAGLVSLVIMLPGAALVRADAAAADSAGGSPHTFKYTPAAGASVQSVDVSGDFNGWSLTATPLSKSDDGSYTATVNLPVGMHHYKLVVDGKGMADPAADKATELDNGFGDVESGIDTAPAPGQAAEVPFHYNPAAGSPDVAVSVAGDFNNWTATTNPMKRGPDGNYTATVAMLPGVHHYKLIVDGKWIPDPAADKSLDADDGFGGKNSGVNASAQQSPNTHTFHYKPADSTANVPVFVVGDFNGWSTTANPMKHDADGGDSLTLELPPGVHHYKLFVNGNWMPDPAADKSLESDDGFGGKNSGVQIGGDAAPAPAH